MFIGSLVVIRHVQESIVDVHVHTNAFVVQEMKTRRILEARIKELEDEKLAMQMQKQNHELEKRIRQSEEENLRNKTSQNTSETVPIVEDIRKHELELRFVSIRMGKEHSGG
jgi:hypothetical protein